MSVEGMLGRVFAACTDEEQAEFINAAGKDARRTWDGFDTQVSRITDKLDVDGRRLVKRLAEFIRSDEESR